MLPASVAGVVSGNIGKFYMKTKREKLEISVGGRLPVSKFRTLEVWCDRSLRKKAEVVGIVLGRVIEIYEQEARADEPIEHFIRRLHLNEPP